MSTAPAPTYEVRTIWEGELVADTRPDTEAAAWADFEEAAREDDGYTIQLVIDDRIVAEHINPDENGEI